MRMMLLLRATHYTHTHMQCTPHGTTHIPSPHSHAPKIQFSQIDDDNGNDTQTSLDLAKAREFDDAPKTILMHHRRRHPNRWFTFHSSNVMCYVNLRSNCKLICACIRGHYLHKNVNARTDLSLRMPRRQSNVLLNSICPFNGSDQCPCSVYYQTVNGIGIDIIWLNEIPCSECVMPGSWHSLVRQISFYIFHGSRNPILNHIPYI